MLINVNEECVNFVEALTPLDAVVDKRKVGKLYEVEIDQATYDSLLRERRVDESWSDTIMRLVRAAQRLRDARC